MGGCDNPLVPEELSRWYQRRLVFGPFRPFEITEVEALEGEIGLPLPMPYRRFLETAGGTHLEYAVNLPDCEPEPLQCFNDLYQLGRNEAGEYGYGTLLGEYRRQSAWWLADEIPLDGLLPIARNGGSDTLFLDLNPATHGRVHAFIHGIPWPGRLQQGMFTQVADDFDTYLDNLLIDPGMAELTWTDAIGTDPADPWRCAVEQWLDNGLPSWRDEHWATG
jgi:hypothetical protein